jgi:DivIVA domain-containing protein
MPLTAEDVKNRQFSSTRFGRGYDEKEVDDFLDEVEAEITKLTRENADLRTRLQLAEQAGRQGSSTPPAVIAPVAAPIQPAAFAQPATPVVSAPVPQAVAPPVPMPVPVPVPAAPAFHGATSGEPANEQALRMLTIAQRTADETVNEARRDADKMLQKARQDADQLERETKEQHRNAVGNLESERERLERKIDELRSFEREYRARLKSYLEGQLRDLDGNAASGPSAINANATGVAPSTLGAGRPSGIGIAPPATSPALGGGAPSAPSMNVPSYGGAQPGRPPAPLFAPVSAPPVPGTPAATSTDTSPAGPPRQPPSGGYEIEDGPEVPPTHS